MSPTPRVPFEKVVLPADATAHIHATVQRLERCRSDRERWRVLVHECEDFDRQAMALVETGDLYELGATHFVSLLWALIEFVKLGSSSCVRSFIELMDTRVPGLLGVLTAIAEHGAPR